MISLEEEIAIYRFGQGASPIDELVRKFDQLTEFDKQTRLSELQLLLVFQVKTIEADVNQAIAESDLDPADPACIMLKTHGPNIGIVHLPQNKLDQVYALLLHLFKLAYQRQLASRQKKDANWRYTDLSDDAVQRILTKHQLLVETTYNNPGFRSEFVSLAKLYHEEQLALAAKRQASASVIQTKFDFVHYDDMLTESVIWPTSKERKAILLLNRSLGKGLQVTYKLDEEEAARLLTAVLERHMVEMYGTGLLP